jgi:type IV secretion system protein VirB2
MVAQRPHTSDATLASKAQAQPHHSLTAILTLALVLLASQAHAAGTGMPWEAPLQQIIDSITGPVAQAIGILAIVTTGLGFAFAEGGTLMRRGLGIVLGIAIAFSAATFGMTFFGFAGGATF